MTQVLARWCSLFVAVVAILLVSTLPITLLMYLSYWYATLLTITTPLAFIAIALCLDRWQTWYDQHLETTNHNTVF